jgi:hypothetical protein
VIDLRGDADLASRGTTDARPLDSLYVFDDPNALNRLGLESETVELRFYFVYRPGAFLPQDVASGSRDLEDLVFENAWKESPWLRGVTVEYTNRTSTLDHWR